MRAALPRGGRSRALLAAVALAASSLPRARACGGCGAAGAAAPSPFEGRSLAGMASSPAGYPGTAEERLAGAVARARSLTPDALSADWGDVRGSLLWAAGLRDLQDVAPGEPKKAAEIQNHPPHSSLRGGATARQLLCHQGQAKPLSSPGACVLSARSACAGRAKVSTTWIKQRCTELPHQNRRLGWPSLRALPGVATPIGARISAPGLTGKARQPADRALETMCAARAAEAPEPARRARARASRSPH